MTTPLRRAATWNRPLMVLAAAMALLSIVATVAIFADSRILLGAPIWLKSWKFAVSIAIYSVTLAWMLSLLPRRSRWADRAVVVIVAAFVVEMVIIVGQVLRGRASHFNEGTPLDAMLFRVMGASIMILWFAHLAIAVILARQTLGDRAASSGVRLGLAGSLLGMLAAIPMTIPRPGMVGLGGAHAVGTADGGPGLPVVGWSTIGGDLRIGHFVGLHALQALPLLALALTLLARRFPVLDDAARLALVRIGGAGYMVLTVLLSVQALRGQPLLRPDAATALGFTALAAAVVGGVAVTLTAASRRACTPSLAGVPR
ncbi:hypothetical protein Val02_00810 [Virgisporangium aliadipatigenens]|uniref:Uncharacterized protein n=1 Tax=Virgisporangium aliadipatigenens TaxID=741659 RepID=A0A8J4DLY0_9ACTN|nr:hypothetical protein [Virgisporangium aliadipatigenens]GIJ43195.1 hypothetical protein Val02_00810 [Virgisporangium aliadipatigenens]